MDLTLAATALLMGLAGGPHCLAMCGAACAGIGRSQVGQSTRALWVFQAGRLVGYSALGALAAASMQGLGWLSVHSAALRPVWTLFHVAAALLGLMLLLRARQPVWLEESARTVWRRVRSATTGLTGNFWRRSVGTDWFDGCLVGFVTVWFAVFSGTGGRPKRQRRSGRGCHGLVCLGQRRVTDGWALVLAAFTRKRSW